MGTLVDTFLKVHWAENLEKGQKDPLSGHVFSEWAHSSSAMCKELSYVSIWFYFDYKLLYFDWEKIFIKQIYGSGPDACVGNW